MSKQNNWMLSISRSLFNNEFYFFIFLFYFPILISTNSAHFYLFCHYLYFLSSTVSSTIHKIKIHLIRSNFNQHLQIECFFFFNVFLKKFNSKWCYWNIMNIKLITSANSNSNADIRMHRINVHFLIYSYIYKNLYQRFLSY